MILDLLFLTVLIMSRFRDVIRGLIFLYILIRRNALFLTQKTFTSNFSKKMKFRTIKIIWKPRDFRSCRSITRNPTSNRKTHLALLLWNNEIIVLFLYDCTFSILFRYLFIISLLIPIIELFVCPKTFYFTKKKFF